MDLHQIQWPIRRRRVRSGPGETKEPLKKEAVAIRKTGFATGIVFGLDGVRHNVLKIKPPLIVNQAEADEILDRFEQSVKVVLRA